MNVQLAPRLHMLQPPLRRWLSLQLGWRNRLNRRHPHSSTSLPARLPADRRAESGNHQAVEVTCVLLKSAADTCCTPLVDYSL
jgi:hypothetical protein